VNRSRDLFKSILVAIVIIAALVKIGDWFREQGRPLNPPADIRLTTGAKKAAITP